MHTFSLILTFILMALSGMGAIYGLLKRDQLMAVLGLVALVSIGLSSSL
jgi:hypothetical protein